MKIGWAGSEILWLQVGRGAVLKVNSLVASISDQIPDATTASITTGRWQYAERRFCKV